MMASSGSNHAVAGGLARHTPVLGRTAVDFLAVREGGVYVDATFGAGGYSREILRRANCIVLAIDRDPEAIASGSDLVQSSGGRFILEQCRFSDLTAVLRSVGYDCVDGIVFDLGVSSMQIDERARGFSFRRDGPLDMRMGMSGATAADVVAAASERHLTRIVGTLGEERHARAIARALVRARRHAPIKTTRALAQVIADTVAVRPTTIHPATRTFQALRIFVNDELGELTAGLAAAEQVLRPGGRLVVVAFHSLEDRIVKSFLAQRAKAAGSSRHLPQVKQSAPTFKLLVRRPITPNEEEVKANPRARSAKLRAAERTHAAPSFAHFEAFLPHLPSLSDIVGAAP
jgi:16S rRNA (cytosine1402-N4)-methyltransferase